ncbi:hypothetical protein [Candidatus Nitronereus thalassa]|uniref:DUF4168 domain-containing protein n=1 Tax=Candidatus Nitronereus thalassa TaxID=3020898 RepID=A0ABU3KC58_9BACT|nr:hypothetical protein [Candidatus Nitronereus thalassa]MDT7044099.1 hypothetical protein [Candidatus Nitronereus thalassa]
MATKFTRYLIGISLGFMIFTGTGLAADPAEVGKFVNARIEIGEMMTNYFSGGNQYGKGGRPDPAQMKKMGEDINAKLSTLLATHNLTIDEYRQRSPEIFANDAAVKEYLNQHPALKERYEALPFSRMGRGGSGRGY